VEEWLICVLGMIEQYVLVLCFILNYYGHSTNNIVAYYFFPKPSEVGLIRPMRRWNRTTGVGILTLKLVLPFSSFFMRKKQRDLSMELYRDPRHFNSFD
jgi:hypothetical protein